MLSLKERIYPIKENPDYIYGLVDLSVCETLDFDSEHCLLRSTKRTNKELLEISSFKREDYFKSLYTQYLGKIVLFSEVLSSSFDLMERLSFDKHYYNRFDYNLDRLVQLGNYHPVVIISNVQTQGKGRGLNQWISPLGCGMFTFLLPISIGSNLGKSMSLIQHIIAVSIVEALNFICWINEKSLKIKWPNDIYWDKHGKISGILLKSIMQADHYYCIIGCGINIFNRQPSVCIYDIIDEENKNEKNKKFKYPSTEEIIAHVISRIESNINHFQNEKDGMMNFKKKYYKYWMHENQQVTCKQNDLSYSGKILGIDDFGFLEIVLDDNTVTTLHPDGNSFDMMHNLIIPK